MQYTATSSERGKIKIGRDFVEAVTSRPVWLVRASDYAFYICFECTGDQATALVADLLKREGRKTSSYMFQRI